MKTIVIWDDGQFQLKYFVLEGDYSHLHQIYINLTDDNRSEELCSMMYDQKTGADKITMLLRFPLAVIRDNPEVCAISAGFVP